MKLHAWVGTIYRLVRLCRTVNPVLLYANGPRAAFYCGLVGRLLQIPAIWHCRIAEPDPLMDWLLLKLCTKVIVNSQATKKRFHSACFKKLKVVYNGVDVDWYRQKVAKNSGRIDGSAKILLMVARISQLKRHDLLLSAFEHIAAEDIHLHLVCVGAPDKLEPHWWQLLQDRTHTSSYSDRIHWIGHVDDARPWYQSAYLLLLPSENESFGRVLIEAMANGVPVIASAAGGVPEIVRNGIDGLLVEPNSAGSLTNAIKTIVNDDTLRKRFSHSAYRRAEDFSLQTHVSHMTEQFQDLPGE